MTALSAAPAEARKPELVLGFGTPQLTWTPAPLLQLQPEGARLTLHLPLEWMPPKDTGGMFGGSFDPNKHWVFRRGNGVMTRATIGASVHFHVTDTARSIDFGLSLLPRAAIAVLRFDPTARWD